VTWDYPKGEGMGNMKDYYTHSLEEVKIDVGFM
jgi:hypothetical protein